MPAGQRRRLATVPRDGEYPSKSVDFPQSIVPEKNTSSGMGG